MTLHRNHRVIRFALSLAVIVLSIGSVVVRASCYPAAVPSFLVHMLDWFDQPGTTLWWFTTNSLFQAFPSTAAGYFQVVLGNTLFWLLSTTIFLWLARIVCRFLFRHAAIQNN